MRAKARLALFAILALGGTSIAGADPLGEADLVVGHPKRYLASNAAPTLSRGEIELAAALHILSDLGGGRYFVPRSLLHRKVRLSFEPTTDPVELRERITAALRSEGIAVDFEMAHSVRLGGGPSATSGLGTLAGDAAAGLAGVTGRGGTPPVPSLSDAEMDRGIHCTDGRCEVERSFFDKMLANIAALATSARLVPSFADGRPNGFKLYAIRPGSLFARLGLENGDTITRVNGRSFATPDEALAIYVSLRSTSAFKIEIKRRGNDISLEIRVKG
jgi:general secretion pathway protein C